jgi:hypothetical protein
MTCICWYSWLGSKWMCYCQLIIVISLFLTCYDWIRKVFQGKFIFTVLIWCYNLSNCACIMQFLINFLFSQLSRGGLEVVVQWSEQSLTCCSPDGRDIWFFVVHNSLLSNELPGDVSLVIRLPEPDVYLYHSTSIQCLGRECMGSYINSR